MTPSTVSRSIESNAFPGSDASTRVEDSGGANASAGGDQRLLSPEVVREHRRGENFPVALRVLSRARRHALLVLYDFARLTDQIGDAAWGNRNELLDRLEADVDALGVERPKLEIVQALAPVAHEFAIPSSLFRRLIDANRFDQKHVDIEDFDGLLAYCRLSANPVGEMVLCVFGEHSPRNVGYSDSICSALQIVEHCQDVAEDHVQGRVYLPRVDRLAAGCAAEDLSSRPASTPLRSVVSRQVARARELLIDGQPLVRALEGQARWAVAGFVAGGLATCDALELADYDPNARPVRPSKWHMLRHGLRLLLPRSPG